MSAVSPSSIEAVTSVNSTVTRIRLPGPPGSSASWLSAKKPVFDQIVIRCRIVLQDALHTVMIRDDQPFG